MEKWRHLAGRVAVILAATASLCAAAYFGPAASAQDPGAAIGQASVERGKQLFLANCSACHGAEGRGGRGGAPDLMLSEAVLKGDAAFVDKVRTGSPRAGMPPFAMAEGDIAAMRAFLTDLQKSLSRRGDRQVALVGDATRGKALFGQECSTCHSINGDLAGIGSRYDTRLLQGRIVMPRGSGVHPGLIALGIFKTDPRVNDSPRRVVVEQPGGKTVEGELLSISDFEVALRTDEGDYRSFVRKSGRPKVNVIDPAQPHIDRLGRYSDGQINDLTAYLAGVK